MTVPAASPDVERVRLTTIDYLRGTFALSVMAFHYSTSALPDLSSPFLVKVAIYAVCAFYVISGISFGYVYRAMRFTRGEIVGFYVKRWFRLAPVYWLAVMTTVMVTWLTLGKTQSWRQIAINLTFLFQLVAPTYYIPVGGWSIGVEWTFYLLFPIVLWTLQRGRMAYTIGLGASLAIAALFAWVLLEPSHSLTIQWPTYINPLNHLFLFVSGVGLSALIGRVRIPARASDVLMVVLMVLFVLYPLAGSDMADFNLSAVRGWNRVFLSAIAIAICAVGTLGTFQFSRPVGRALAYLGVGSYSIYLLHASAYTFSSYLVRAGVLSEGPALLFAVVLTLASAYFVYRYLEAPMIAVGKRLSHHIRRRLDAGPIVSLRSVAT